MERPDWHTYFMSIAFVVAQRSIDTSTKVGCVVVNKENSILTTGYNGPPRGMKDINIPTTRPEKYSYMSHAEINAIANAARHGISLRDSVFYVTTPPCDVCFRSIINCGAEKVIYGPIPTGQDHRYNFDTTIRMMKESGISLVSFESLHPENPLGFIEVLESIPPYLKKKIEK